MTKTDEEILANICGKEDIAMPPQHIKELILECMKLAREDVLVCSCELGCLRTNPDDACHALCNHPLCLRAQLEVEEKETQKLKAEFKSFVQSVKRADKSLPYTLSGFGGGPHDRC